MSWRRNSLSHSERFVQDVEFPVGENEAHISIAQDEETVSCVWDASIVLGRYFGHQHLNHGRDYCGLRVLEIGSGCGLAGLALAYQGAEVVLTDMPAILPVLRRNAVAFAQAHPGRGSVTVCTFSWGDPLPPEIASRMPFDLVIGADVIYELQHFDLLHTAMLQVTSPTTHVLLAHERRWRDVDRFFFETVEPSFTWEELDRSEHDPVYSADPITILSLRRK